MSSSPSDRKYAKTHEWVRVTDDGTVEVGISDYAQESLGDITYVQLPEVGETFAAGAVFGVVESVKAASDLYSPLAGEVIAVNRELDATPELVNQSPYAEGWIMKLRPAEGDSAGGALLDAEAYEKEIS